MTALTKTKDGTIRTVKSFAVKIGRNVAEFVKDNGKLRLANDSRITFTPANRGRK